MPAQSPSQSGTRNKLGLQIVIWMGISVLLYLLYAVFSYSLTDPNLIITGWSPYWQFQQWMWRTFFDQPDVLAGSYSWLMTLIVGWWVAGLWWFHRQKQSFLVSDKTWQRSLLGLAITVGVLFGAYNALSHDVFNYMFNAKMVLVFDANPHQQVALDFAGRDDWLRFMHNTHTPAPYGYGWTAISLVPSLAGMGTFILTWLSFRMMSILSLIGLIAGYWWWQRSRQIELPWWIWVAIVWNPLLLIEIIANSHNDLWMMVPAVFSLLLVEWLSSSGSNATKLKHQLAWGLVSAGLLAFSVSIKLATVVLVPIWLGLAFWPRNWNESGRLAKIWWPLAASLALFVPLLTLRSQQFHPWYLTWVLVWLPLLWQAYVTAGTARFSKKSLWFQLNQLGLMLTPIWITGLLTLTVGSLFRYLPWLAAGSFEPPVITQQKSITWIWWLVGVLGSTVLQFAPKSGRK